jgi:hypothetical protein
MPFNGEATDVLTLAEKLIVSVETMPNLKTVLNRLLLVELVLNGDFS